MNTPESIREADLQPQSQGNWVSGDTDSQIQSDLERIRDAWRRHWEERRSQQRYPLGIPYAYDLGLDSGRYPPMPVQLQDISLGGACLLISSLVDLRCGEMGELHHPAARPGAASVHRRRLRVCWLDVRDWMTAVGVAFEPPLEQLPLGLELG